MKKIFIIISLFLTVVIAADKISASFRNSALGGAIYDDLDLIYDPIELRFVNGIRLYTNLSNLTSTTEQVLGTKTDNEFLFGFSMKNPRKNNLWHSLLVTFEDSKISNSVSIDNDSFGYGTSNDHDLSGKGHLVSEYTTYYDESGNNFFDHKKENSQERKDFTTDKDYSIIFNNSFSIKNLSAGIKVSIGKDTGENTIASASIGSTEGHLTDADKNDASFANNFSWMSKEDDFSSSQWSEEYNLNESGEFLNNAEKCYLNFDSAVMWDWKDNMEVRGDFSMHFTESINKYNDNYSGSFVEFNPPDIHYANNFNEDELNISRDDLDGFNIALGMSLRKIFNKEGERKNNGFWDVGLDINFGSYDYISSSLYEETIYEYEQTGVQEFIDIEYVKTESSDIGDQNTIGKSISALFNIPLGDKVYFGIGGFLGDSQIERNTNFTLSTVEGDSIYYVVGADWASNWSERKTSIVTAKNNYENSVVTFVCPVGIETKFGKNGLWAARFGSTFSRINTTIKEISQITNSEPTSVEQTSAELTTVEETTTFLEEDHNTYNSSSELTIKNESQTVFSYGLGCNPTENLQIDLIGLFGTTNDMLNTNFLQDLRLSFTMKF